MGSARRYLRKQLARHLLFRQPDAGSMERITERAVLERVGALSHHERPH